MSRKAAAAVLEPSKGIKGCMKQRILLDLIESVPGSFKVMIIDKTSAEVLSVCLRMSELMDHGITLVEEISSVRQPLPKSPAMYFIAPTKTSVNLLIEDWKSKDKYQEAHVFFTSSAPDEIIQQIAASNIARKIKNMKDMLLDFSVPESLSFHFGQLDEMSQLMGPSTNPSVLQTAVSKLTSVAHTIGDNPIIRYQNTSLCRMFAEQAGASIEKLAQEVITMKKQEPRTMLVIVDRSVDAAAPLIHDRTYESLLDDLMPLKNMMYEQTFKDRSGKDATRKMPIDEMDPVWTKFRHTFLPKAIEEVPAALKKLLDDNPALAGGLEKGAKLSEVGNAIRSLPEFQEKQAKLSMHIDLLSKIMDEYKLRGLTDVSALEQKMVCGDITFKDALDAVKKARCDDDSKLRLILLLVVCFSNSKDFTSAKRTQLIQDCGLQMQADSIENIDVVVSKTGALKGTKRANPNGDPYTPQVRLIVEEVASGSLSTTDFPFLRPSDASAVAAPATGAKKSLRSGTARLASASGGAKAGERVLDLGNDEKITLTNPQRVVVFILGGVTRVEVRSAYDVTRELKREAIVGGTSLLRSNNFVRQLPGLK
eukprot:CAMPEP_0176415300 /NCGR_PEP_ID=MMETSP0127-20121128/5733_1 /TAXON_ID=938130 /ORGANISM="Platyophrya macrostoma, Strain WH" /LENGTH=593 /DNA_ID=CAMNT_0017795287 /DNA_START=63 /DNA_END=1844 /DNA_ORIENTATION=+